MWYPAIKALSQYNFPKPHKYVSAVEENFKMLCTLNHRNWRKVQKQWWVYSRNWIKCYRSNFHGTINKTFCIK